VSVVRRLVTGAKALARDPVERRAYVSRAKFLLHGTEGVQAWSLEYRSALTGRFAVPAERLAPEPPQTLYCPDDCKAHSPLGHHYDPRFTYRMPNTVASTASGATLACGTPEPPFFVRESISWPFESVVAHGLELPEANQATSRIRRPAAVFPTTTNYYHWLIEDLPTALRAHEAVPTASLLAYAPGITDRHRLVAESLGVSLEPSPLTVSLDEQILAGRGADSFFPHPDDVVRLRSLGQRLTEGDQLSSGAEKIYVSRRYSRRPLAQEEALEGLLTERGFRVVHLEREPWLRQIELFSVARLVVAPHGAGLANLAFSPPGVRVVELTVGYMFNRCFEWLCHVGGHDYSPVEADSVPLTAHELADRVDSTLT